MDLYLPADFRQLHDSAPDDWRDASTSRTARNQAHAGAGERNADMIDPNNLCADPLWRVI